MWQEGLEMVRGGRMEVAAGGWVREELAEQEYREAMWYYPQAEVVEEEQ